MVHINSFYEYFDDYHYYEFPNIKIWVLNKKTNETFKLELQQLSKGLMTVKKENENRFDVRSNSDIFVDNSTMIMIVFEAKKIR